MREPNQKDSEMRLQCSRKRQNSKKNFTNEDQIRKKNE